MNPATCTVCGEVLDQNRASCQECGGEFHLALRIDVPARDCGDAWIDDEVQALAFVCNRCLGRDAPAEPAAVAERKRYARRPGGARQIARSRRRGAEPG